MWCGARNGGAPHEASDRPLARHRGDDRRLVRLVRIERREQPRDRPRQQRLARAGRRRSSAARGRRRARSRARGAPRPGRGRPRGPARRRSSERRRQRPARPRPGSAPRASWAAWPRTRLPRTSVDGLGRATQPAATSIPGTRRASSSASAGHDDAPGPAPGERRDHGQQARHGPDLAAERRARRAAPSGRTAGPARSRRGSRSRSRDPAAEPAFGTSAGARFTVMRRGGWTKPAFRSAPRTRSRASRRAASARPTIVNPGRPGRHVDLDADWAALEAAKRGGEDRGEHAPTVRAALTRRPLALHRHLPPARRRVIAASNATRRLPDSARRHDHGGRRASGARLLRRSPARSHGTIAPSGESAFVNMTGAPGVQRADRAPVLVDDLVVDRALQGALGVLRR